METVKCDYCPGDKGLLLNLTNGDKVYMCAYCCNELDRYVRNDLGFEIFQDWVKLKMLIMYGRIEELRLKELIAELKGYEVLISLSQKKWLLSNRNKPLDDILSNITYT